MQIGSAASPSVQRLPPDIGPHLRASLVLVSASQAVHELVANSLDADARTIEVAMDCQRMVFTVRDDGRGMARSDIELFATTAHATSKCTSDATPSWSSEEVDLLSAASSRTQGWRGEAVSSIARLARIEVETRSGAQTPAPASKRRRLDSGQQDAALPTASDPRSFVFHDDETYAKCIRHGRLISIGFSPTARQSPGTTITISELYHTVPVRLARMMQAEERQMERERVRQVILRLALIHPHVKFELFDATLSPSAGIDSPQQTPAAHSSGVHPSASASSSSHLAIRPLQRIWSKPATSSLLENFLIASSGAATSSPILSSFSPLAGRSRSSRLISDLFELDSFTPTCSFAAAGPYVSAMQASGFFADPTKLHLLHREHQYVYVNRHAVNYQPLQQALDAMYGRLAAALGFGDVDQEGASPQLSNTNKLQRGSIKQKRDGAPSAKQVRRRYPAYLLHLELPPAHYDLLFDPQKTTVEFKCAWAITEGLMQGIELWLKKQVESARTAASAMPPSPFSGDRLGSPAPTRLRPPLSPSTRAFPSVRSSAVFSPRPSSLVQPVAASPSPRPTIASSPHLPASPSCSPKFSPKLVSPRWRSYPRSSPPPAMASRSAIQLTRAHLQQMHLIGQVENQVIVAIAGNVLLGIDQHAADERRRLEYLHRHVLKFLAQRILPESVPVALSSTELATWQRHSSELQQWNWRARVATTLGGPSLSISLLAVPLVCGVELDLDDFREHLVQLTSAAVWLDPTKQLQRIPTPAQRILNYKSCRSSVMFGDPLTPTAMCSILNDLSACEVPWNCAHGRPTMTPICQIREEEGHSADAGWTEAQEAELRQLINWPWV